MPGKPKFCPECKGYGDIYVQTISRYGDKRIKSKTPIAGMPCVDCKGTGMITLKTEKQPQFTVSVPEDALDEVLAERDEPTVEAKAVTDEEMNLENDSLTEEEKQSIPLVEGFGLDDTDTQEGEEDQEETVFDEKYIEPKEGEMPL
tara:strand:+ start:3959 stop:4396 length:438 start_codon:yes stop_codon:yes gene_type:complete